MGAVRWVSMVLLLCCQVAARAEPLPVQAVQIDVCVAEQDVDRVRERVHEPILEALKTVPGASNMSGTATHGVAQFQIIFRDGATRNDRAAVEMALERLQFAPDVEIRSMRVELGPSHDGLFSRRLACTGYLRRER